jgi:hypothetical protein
MLTMFHSRHKVAFGHCITLEFVRDQNIGERAHSFEQLAEKALGRMSVTPPLHQDIESVAVLIDCPPSYCRCSVFSSANVTETPLLQQLDSTLA